MDTASQGDHAVLENSVGSLYEVDDGYAGAGEAMLEMIQKCGVLQEGSQKMVKDWADKYKVIQKTYLDMVEDHFKKLEDIIELKNVVG
jgi:hypothetical protein